MMKNVIDEIANGQTGDRWMKAFLIFAITANVIIMALALASVWWATSDREFQPFRFPAQQVLNRLPGHGDQAAATVGDSIVVRATRCNISGETIRLHGTKVWGSVSPPGNSVATFGVGVPMKPGCTTKVFVNTVPPEAVMQMRLLLKTRPYVVWQIRGSETVEHKDGATRSWETQPFYVYPERGK